MLTEAWRATKELVEENVSNWRRTYGMAQVTLTKRYSGSALGVTWAVIRPVIYIAAYWFAVNIGMRGGNAGEGAPYLIWLVPGNMAWFFVSDCLNQAGTSISSNSQFVTKMKYPVATLPVSEVLSHFLVHLVMMCLTVGLLLVTGYGLTLTALQLPYYMLCAFAFSVVVATLFSALTAVSADIAHLIKSVMSLLFWITPVLWSVGRLSGALKLIVLANPITYIVGGYRDALVTHRWVTASLPYTAYFWGVVAILVPLASYVYAKLAPEFADVL